MFSTTRLVRALLEFCKLLGQTQDVWGFRGMTYVALTLKIFIFLYVIKVSAIFAFFQKLVAMATPFHH